MLPPRHRYRGERCRLGALNLTLTETIEFLLKALDILTDWSVLLLLLFVVFRRQFIAFVTALLQEHIPGFLKQMTRIKVGPFEAEIGAVRDSIEDHSPALRALLSTGIALQDILNGQAEGVDDSEDAATDDEAEAVDEEEDPVESAISEFEAARLILAKLRGTKQ